MNVNPKHCPFCGNSTITKNAGAVSCYQCSAKIELQNCNTHYAVERWNTRAVESELAALQAECEKLRALLLQSAPIIHAHAGASHMLEGFKPKRNKWDALVEQIDAALAKATGEIQ